MARDLAAVNGDHAVAASGLAPKRRLAVLFAVAVLVLALDLATKMYIVSHYAGRAGSTKLLGGLIYISPARNSGAAFSIGGGATVLFSAVALVVVVVIARVASRLRSLPWAIALGLILGGAAGNLVDRIFRDPGFLRGAVVDWISVLRPDGRAWPIFNLADSGIVCGGVLAVLLAVLGFDVAGGRLGRVPHDPTDVEAKDA